MALKNSSKKKSKKPADNHRRQRAAQILFGILALILILSMVFAAVAKF